MSGGLKNYEKCLKEGQFRPIAMQVLAGGAITPQEAVKFLSNFPKIKSVLFGASSKLHIEEMKELIEEYL